MAAGIALKGEQEFPIEISYTCPKCGKAVSYTEEVFVETFAAFRGSSVSSENAKAALDDDAKRQLRQYADQWKHGFMNRGDMVKHPPKKLICPGCGMQQVPNAGGKCIPGSEKNTKKTLALLLTLLLIWFIGFVVIIVSDAIHGLWILPLTAVCIAAGIGVGKWEKSLGRRALNDPKYMEKQFGSVLNDSVYADFSPYGLGKIKINSEK